MVELDDSQLLVTNVQVYSENGFSEQGYILIKDSTISEVNVGDFKGNNNIQVLDGKGLKAIPGFIDGHIHGANGADVMDGTPEALETMASILPEEGTTSFLATTITQTPENIENALKNVAKYQNKRGQAEIIGVHLEGPFIAENKAGAQPKEYIIKPNQQQFDHWQRLSGNNIKTITMAPEKDEDGALIRYLAEQGINVSAGHTDSGFHEIKQAVQHGVRQLTHLCNAMSGVHHRDVGAVGAAFLLEDIRNELIADGIHVSPEMLDIIFDNVGSERLMLITDALRAKCLQPGTYDLGGQEVTVSEDRAKLPSGSLAGSILKMVDGAKNMIRYTAAELEHVVEMAAINPAKQLGVYDRKGSLEVGKDADILIIDDNLNINVTICRGKIAYKGD